MRFLRKAPGLPQSLGILAGAFDPPTRAHLALAQSTLDTFETEEILFVLPEEFPHKQYGSVTLGQRLQMLEAALGHDQRMSIGIANGGLFLEIARECRQAYGDGVRLRFICGRDTAERIVNWDYGPEARIAEQLREYELLVAPRLGTFHSPIELRHAIGHLAAPPGCDEVSSTEVRERISRGEQWEHLVPDAVLEQVRAWYSSGPQTGKSR